MSGGTDPGFLAVGTGVLLFLPPIPQPKLLLHYLLIERLPWRIPRKASGYVRGHASIIAGCGIGMRVVCLGRRQAWGDDRHTVASFSSGLGLDSTGMNERDEGESEVLRLRLMHCTHPKGRAFPTVHDYHVGCPATL